VFVYLLHVGKQGSPYFGPIENWPLRSNLGEWARWPSGFVQRSMEIK